MNPRVLVVEDDPVSARFLADALAALPAAVDVAPSLAQARRLIEPRRHGLWLVDMRLPDGEGASLLAMPDAPPAIALSAEVDPASRRAWRDAGFVEVLAKPLSSTALRVAVARWLPADPWDDARALAVMAGDAAAVMALRKLFLEELPGQRDAVSLAFTRGDGAAAGAHLHRLKASCGFVGAAALRDCVVALSERPADAGCLARFRARVDELLRVGTP